MSYTMPAHSKNAGLMEYGAKRSATPLLSSASPESRITSKKAPSPLRFAGAVQNAGLTTR